MQRLAVAVLTYDRPKWLEEVLRDLHASDLPVGWVRDVTLVDNSEAVESKRAVDGYLEHGLFDRLIRPQYNVGIAPGWNLAWSVANAEDAFAAVGLPDVFVLVQDDVSLDPGWFVDCLEALDTFPDLPLVTGYNSPCHETLERRTTPSGVRVHVQPHLPGVHLMGRREFWEGIFPLRTPLHHAQEDWEISKDSSGAPTQNGKLCACVPGLVVHHGGKESTWNPKEHVEYVDPIAETMP